MVKAPLQQNQQTTLEAISGVLERITYRNEESGFAIIKVQTKNRKDLVTVTGHMSNVSIGESIEAEGQWYNDLKYGLQFKATIVKSITPNTLSGIEKYLGSGLIKGIGPSIAKKLVSAFKDKVFEVIENNPSYITKIHGIGRAKAESIVKNWSDQKSIREIIIFLQSHGIGTARATKIFKTYGKDSVKIVSENPYRLAKDIKGIGFLSADKLAQNLGIDPNSPLRARAGLNYILNEALNSGHCGLPTAMLLEKTNKLLEITMDILEDSLEKEIEDRFLVKDTIELEDVVFLKSYHTYEKYIAQKISRLSRKKSPWANLEIDKALRWVEEKLLIDLADNQKVAIKTAINSNVAVITGGPGTGKTTILNSLIQILSAKQIKIKLAAPTGRASKRLSESTGMEAQTIHRLIKFGVGDDNQSYNINQPLKCDLLIVDESSMIDTTLMYNLLRALPDDAALILVGDVDQLPSVGAGKVLKDIIDSKKVPTVRLNKIFRQKEDSQIIGNAHLINQGIFPKIDNQLEGNDFFFIESKTPEDILTDVIKLVQTRIPNHFKLDPLKDIQTLSPMQRGTCGCRSLNIELQKALNGNSRDNGIERFGQLFSVGDKVMQMENNYDRDVYNGDVGYITHINMEEHQVSISFDNRIIIYDFDDLTEIAIAYAITIHKSQGSEYPAVVIPISTQHFPMLQKNLIYTAVTRGKSLVFLVGQKQALAIAVKNNKEGLRYSKLKELI